MSDVKSQGSTLELHPKLHNLSAGWESGILGVALKCVISRRTPAAKAALWNVTDAEARKLGERTGLDTLVVPAVNGAHLVLEVLTPPVPELTR